MSGRAIVGLWPPQALAAKSPRDTGSAPRYVAWMGRRIDGCCQQTRRIPPDEQTMVVWGHVALGRKHWTLRVVANRLAVPRVITAGLHTYVHRWATASCLRTGNIDTPACPGAGGMGARDLCNHSRLDLAEASA